MNPDPTLETADNCPSIGVHLWDLQNLPRFIGLFTVSNGSRSRKSGPPSGKRDSRLIFLGTLVASGKDLRGARSSRSWASSIWYSNLDVPRRQRRASLYNPLEESGHTHKESKG